MNFVQLLQIAGYDRDSRADAVPIALGTNELNQHRVISVSSFIPEQLRSAVEIINDHIDIAVVIDVAKSSSPTCTFLRKRSTELGAYLGKRAVTVVVMHEVSLPVSRQLRIDMTVDDQEINPTVVVVVKKLGSPTNVGKTYGSDFCGIRDIGKRTVAIIVIKGVVVVVEICDKQIEFAVMIIVTKSDSHASLFAAVFIYRGTGVETNVFEGAVAVIVVKEIRRRIVCDIDIDQAIAIKIAGNNSQSIVTVRIGHARLP